MDRLGKVDSWVQAVEDKATKEDNNKENNNGEDLNIASDIIYIGQPTVKDFENLAVLNKLINNAKYQ
jgi:hypothetical protein